MRNRLAVLGQGQLGWMLARAGDRLGLNIDLLDPQKAVPPEAGTPITVESEHWPDNANTRALQEQSGWQNTRALSQLVDRRRQKALLDELSLATSPWCQPAETHTPEELHKKLGPDVFLKSARGGYDGKGQERFKAGQTQPLPDWKSEAIAEAAIPFDTEVSLVGARGRQGQCVFYRLTENLHQKGVLTLSLSQAGRFDAVQAQAEEMLSRLMAHLDYVGVMAMECFLVGDRLLINEIAPRVHNSGHWTQDGASLSQFELHLRALLDWPLPQPAQPGTSLMINLLGLEHPLSWLHVAGARLYWYGKSLRPGRKMGHINMTHDDPAQLAEWLRALPLPESYLIGRDWALERLAAQ